MPSIIPHIDAVARREQRTVLYIEFHPQERPALRRYRYQEDAVRDRILDWLDRHNFAWHPCGDYADTRVMRPWYGQVYLDVGYDETLPEYGRLRDFLENADGTMRHEGVRFCAMPLATAERNAAHDAPGFWERWAENF